MFLHFTFPLHSLLTFTLLVPKTYKYAQTICLLTYKVLLMLHLQNIYEPTQNDAMQCSQLECCVKNFMPPCKRNCNY